MEAQAAITAAKSYLKSVFADENIINIGLEELDYDGDQDAWQVTVGFSRPWDTNTNNVLNNAFNVPQYRRTYKVVTIDNKNGRFVRVSNREAASA